MTSRDERANYYDLELPDGTRTEVWAVLRAVLTPEEAVGYTKGCLLTRIMRDGRKPEVDRLREAEKVGIEAGMLREAMAALLATPRAIAVTVSCDDPATRIAELERERDAQAQRATDVEAAFRRERTRADALHAELTTTRHDLTALSGTYDAEMEFRAEMRRELGARDDEGFPDFLRRVCAELSDLRDRYRPRRQSEEPAPRGASVLRWVSSPWVSSAPRWVACHEQELLPGHTWTHQPPAPGEGE